MSDTPAPPLDHLLLRQNDALSERLRSRVPLAGIQELVDLLHQPTTHVSAPLVESSTNATQASTLASTSTLSRQPTSPRCFTPSTTCIGTGSDHTWRGSNVEDNPRETEGAATPSDVETQSNDLVGFGGWTQGHLDGHVESALDEEVLTTKTPRPCVKW